MMQIPTTVKLTFFTLALLGSFYAHAQADSTKCYYPTREVDEFTGDLRVVTVAFLDTQEQSEVMGITMPSNSFIVHFRRVGNSYFIDFEMINISSTFGLEDRVMLKLDNDHVVTCQNLTFASSITGPPKLEFTVSITRPDLEMLVSNRILKLRMTHGNSKYTDFNLDPKNDGMVKNAVACLLRAN